MQLRHVLLISAYLFAEFCLPEENACAPNQIDDLFFWYKLIVMGISRGPIRT
jgi:hypothetical protein